MPKIVPVKNISHAVVDVKKPNVEYTRLNETKKVKFITSNIKLGPIRLKTRGSRKKLWWGGVMALAGFLAFVYFTGVHIKEGRAGLMEKGGNILNNFARGVESIRNFKPQEAKLTLTQNEKDLLNLTAILQKPYNRILITGLEKISPALKNAGGLLKKIAGLNSDFLQLSELLSDIQINGFNYFQKDGGKLMTELSSAEKLTQKIKNEVEAIRNTVSELSSFSDSFANINKIVGEDYIKYNSDLQNWNIFLGNIIALLNGNNKHLLLLFQNPAEIRPGGGFIGSYADLTVSQGQLQDIDVRDIYDPDGQFVRKFIPPSELQGLTKIWGARDANWFFDFPTSAKTVVSFLEQSKIYEERGIKFEAALALNINLLKTILTIAGPISLPDYKFAITADNFLNEIQREVESGEDKKAGEPKKILKILTPIILEKLSSFTVPEKQELLNRFREHLEHKNIMIFAKDAKLASFFSSAGVDGAIYELPNNFWGSYLAVVNANVAGGKSDAFIKEIVDLRLDVDSDGGVFGDLKIERKHEGDLEKDSWWRATNKDFIKIFINPGSSIVALKGNDVKNSTALDYSKDYENYPELAAIEKTKIFLSDLRAWTMSESGKTVVGTWMNLPAGKTKTLNLRYQASSGDKTIIAPNKKFRFVFERQSGVENILKLTIGAPLGYTWLESKSTIYFYETENPKARTIIDLTLVK